MACGQKRHTSQGKECSSTAVLEVHQIAHGILLWTHGTEEQLLLHGTHSDNVRTFAVTDKIVLHGPWWINSESIVENCFDRRKCQQVIYGAPHLPGTHHDDVFRVDAVHHMLMLNIMFKV